MSWLQVVFLALIQGLTEFLPISSSAHLILPSALLDWPDQGLAFDVAVHVGTLLAVVIYFRRDLVVLTASWLRHCFRRQPSPESALAWNLIVATVPVCVAGLLLDDLIEQHLRSVLVIAVTTIAFGLLLGLADRGGSRKKSMPALGVGSALWIGCAQVLALIPGTSRSGITMTAALALGFDRVTAARFSFLLAVPVILLSGGYKSIELLGMADVPWIAIGLATLVAAVTAYLCIGLFLRFVNRIGMMPFVWYRLALGLLLIALMVSGVAG